MDGKACFSTPTYVRVQEGWGGVGRLWIIKTDLPLTAPGGQDGRDHVQIYL